jgi:hypothetical protein
MALAVRVEIVHPGQLDLLAFILSICHYFSAPPVELFVTARRS